jgi:hypothetical protein
MDKGILGQHVYVSIQIEQLTIRNKTACGTLMLSSHRLFC